MMKNRQISSPCHWWKWLICPASDGLVQTDVPILRPQERQTTYKKSAWRHGDREGLRFQGPRKKKQKKWAVWSAGSPSPGSCPCTLVAAGSLRSQQLSAVWGEHGDELQVRTHLEAGIHRKCPPRRGNQETHLTKSKLSVSQLHSERTQATCPNLHACQETLSMPAQE